MKRPGAPSHGRPAPLVPTSSCRFDLGLDPFPLEAGVPLPRLHLSGWWAGPDSDLEVLARRAVLLPETEPVNLRTPDSPPRPPSSGPGLDPAVPTILLIHSLTGDARAGGPGGWWEPVVGPNRPFDPQRTRLLCFNNLGGCAGSFGASASDWPWVKAPPLSGQPPDVQLPAPTTTWDQSRAILRALDALGIERVRLAVGGSLGGMLVLALGVLAPARFERLMPIAASERASPWIIGLNHVARQTILLDPDWPKRADRGLSLARQLAHMSYRAEPGLTQRQGRLQRLGGPAVPLDMTDRWSVDQPYAQETYLEHLGQKLVARFDVRSYLTQLAAMDHHDIERRPPAPEEADRWDRDEPWLGRQRLQASIDAIGIDSDVLYDPSHMRALARGAPGRRYHEIQSLYGHDAFLIEWAQLETILWAAGAPFDGATS